uniref:F-box domain-containing protein n=1 Tax=Tetradesmus obliquus TaxID=3088 RepID=A0A383WG50_TETOB|eukprot:jgi/Sobl393_1/7110/SZX75726.1
MAPRPVSPQADLLQSPALPLLLQHGSVHTDLQAVLQLCCTSKAMRAAVLQHCRGLLDVSFTASSMQHAQRFVAWVAKHGQLMGCLHILPDHHHTECEMYGFDPEMEEAPKLLQQAQLCIASALKQLQQQPGEQGGVQQQQQGAQGGVQLRELQLVPVGRAAEALLQATASSKLLRLDMRCYAYMYADEHPMSGSGSPVGSSLSSMISSIASLGQLQSLTVVAVLEPEEMLHVLPALTSLTQLGIYHAWPLHSYTSKQFCLAATGWQAAEAAHH